MEFTSADLFLTDASPALRGDFAKTPFTSLNWPERRLLITEIAFLTRVWNPEEIAQPKCIYINSNVTSGRHLQILSDLFPKIHFVIYSIQSLEVKPVEDRISVFTGQADGIFTVDTAADFAGFDDVILISNLETQASVNMLMEEYTQAGLKFEDGLDRASILKQNPGEATDALWYIAMERFRIKERMALAGDLTRQQSWLRTMRPRFALIKVRFPVPIMPAAEGSSTYNDPMGVVDYTDGDYYWPTWAPADFGEVRLSVDRPEGRMPYLDRIWNLWDFAAQRRYHNNVVRRQIHFINPCADQSELLDDYDSTYECYVLAEYLSKYFPPAPAELITKVQQLSYYFTQTLGGLNLAERRDKKVKKYVLKPNAFELSPYIHGEPEPPGKDSPNNWFDPRLG